MNLIPWKKKHDLPVRREFGTFPALTEFRREMNQVFERFCGESWPEHEAWPGEITERTAELLPSVDVSENDQSITVRAEVPGMEPKDIDVHVSGNVLTVCGEKKESSEQKGEDYFHCERRFGSFRRSIELPTSADLEHIEAEMKNGVLTVSVAKTGVEQSKKVSIRSAEPVSMVGTEV